MGYVSFDASVKIHMSGRYTSTKTSKTGRGGIYGYIKHIDRGTDRKNGCEVGHSNPDINPDYTLLNESYYKDESGKRARTKRSKDMAHAILRRVDYAKKNGARIYDGGKNDMTIVRPLVVQLDPDTIAGHKDTWVMDSVGILEDMFGQDNIAGFSIHRDETNVHLHVCFVPVYEYEDKQGRQKCSVSQTKFFTSPGALAGMHKRIRKALKDKGYDVEMENKPIEEHLAGYYDKQGNWHQQGLTPDQLKELTNKEIQLRLEMVNVKIRQEELDHLEKAMRELQSSAAKGKAQLERERQNLKRQEAVLKQDQTSVQAQLQALAMEKMSVQNMKTQAENMLEKAQSTAAVCDQILSEEKHLNTKFLEFCEKEGKRHKQDVRGYVEYLYKKFLKERRENMSPLQEELYRDRFERLSRGNTKKAAEPEPNIILTDSASEYSFV